MTSEVYWIDSPWRGRLAILPRPRGGDWLEEDVLAWRRAGINTLVSLLTPTELTELELTQEAHLAQAHGIDCMSFPIPDRGVPASRQAVADLVRELEKKLAAGENVGVHCRAGIGRSPLIVACLLVQSGMDSKAALKRVAAARGWPVPETAEQREWVEKFARNVVAARE